MGIIVFYYISSPLRTYKQTNIVIILFTTMVVYNVGCMRDTRKMYAFKGDGSTMCMKRMWETYFSTSSPWIKRDDTGRFLAKKILSSCIQLNRIFTFCYHVLNKWIFKPISSWQYCFWQFSYFCSIYYSNIFSVWSIILLWIGLHMNNPKFKNFEWATLFRN